MSLLQKNLAGVCNAFTEALQDIKKVGDFTLEEVTLGVEVSAEGGVSFIGSAKAGGKGAITLKFVKA